MIKDLLSFFILMLISLPMNVHGQQKYPKLTSQTCDITEPYSSLYKCNGQQNSCKAFLIFKSRPPYNTIRAISSLVSTSSSIEELSRANNEAEYDAVLPNNKEVIVPVNCSCDSGEHYRSNASVPVGPGSDTYYVVAMNLFQGLSTCESLKRANRPLGVLDLTYGLELKVPLRCACATRNQIEKYGTKYLLTYPVNANDNIPDIAKRFGVSSDSVFEANELKDDNPTIFVDVPILVPLSAEPLSSQTVIHNDDSSETRIHPRRFRDDFITKKPKSKPNMFLVFGVIIAGCSVLVLVLALVIVVFVVYKKKRSSPKEVVLLPRRQGSKQSLSPRDLRLEIASFESGPRVFAFEEVKRATESFGPENRIKGSVYLGVFDENKTFAVKQTKSKDPWKEVNMLNRLNHFNLTKLEGVCSHHDRFYMVFEFMETGSLREWLMGNYGNKSWSKRIEIALDIAHGLNYLHSFTKPGFVHKNIKTSNILLDKDLRAKIANFGLAGPASNLNLTASRSTTDFEAIKTTSHVVGTRGYVAPEYLANGISTTKIDVFAFGVVVLELLSGKKAMTAEEGSDGKQMLLSARIVEILSNKDVEGELEMFVDCGLKEDCYYDNQIKFREIALRVAKLSVACLNRDPETRPSMSEVVSSLSKILVDLRRFYV